MSTLSFVTEPANQSFAYYFFGDMSIGYVMSFYIYAIMGVLFSLGIQHQAKKFRKVPRKTSAHSKNIKSAIGAQHKDTFWGTIKESMVRMFVNIVAIFVVMKFPDKLSITSADGMFLAFSSGFSIDLIVLIISKIQANMRILK